jgi:hypothetical protein
MSSVQELVSMPDNTGNAGQTARVPVSTLNLKWVFTHYMTAWVFEGGAWLPDLTRLSFRDGLNGQSDGNTNAPKAHAQSKGATVIEPGNGKLGPYKAYRHTLPAYDPNTKAAGTYFNSMWEKPTLIGPGGRNVRWTFDQKGYDAFRALLVTNGVIEPITRVVAEGKVEALRSMVDNLKGLPRNTQRDEKIAAMIKMADEMEASLDSIEDVFEEEEETPIVVAPAPRKRTRKLGTPSTEKES